MSSVTVWFNYNLNETKKKCRETARDGGGGDMSARSGRHNRHLCITAPLMRFIYTFFSHSMLLQLYAPSKCRSCLSIFRFTSSKIELKRTHACVTYGIIACARPLSTQDGVMFAARLPFLVPLFLLLLFQLLLLDSHWSAALSSVLFLWCERQSLHTSTKRAPGLRSARRSWKQCAIFDSSAIIPWCMMQWHSRDCTLEQFVFFMWMCAVIPWSLVDVFRHLMCLLHIDGLGYTHGPAVWA